LPLSYLPSQSGIPPVGTILAYVGDLNKIPTNWHLCDGTNGTPDLRKRFLEGVTDGVGQFHSAGLPNITGAFGNTEEKSATQDGVFSYTMTSDGAGSETQIKQVASHIKWYSLEGNLETGYFLVEKEPLADWPIMHGFNWSFDASRASRIYGNSSTVQPSSYTVYFIMRIK